MLSATGSACLTNYPRERGQPRTPEKRQNLSARVQARPHLLLVAADAEVQMLIRDVFPPDSAEVSFEVSLEPWKIVVGDNSSLNVILMELANPVERCFELVSQLKDLCSSTEIIFISRIADDHLWVESIQQGAYDLLQKPLDRNEVLRIVSNAIQKSQADRRDELRSIQKIKTFSTSL
ncbi:MAG: response regulator [Acidobacteriota bacterium]